MMPADLTAEVIPPRTHRSEAMLSVEVSEEDLLGLQVLAAVAGVGESDSETFAQLVKSTFHRGVMESCEAAGLTWPADQAGSAAGEDGGADRATDRAADGPAPRTGGQALRPVALWTAAAATVILIVGSYAGHWTWTGLTQNGQVWDWMQLLLLPVAIGTFPLWLRFSGQMSPARRKALTGAVIAFAAFVLVGYLVPLRWTGFRGHTLWNWLTLIVLPITVTAATVWPKIGRTFGPAYRRLAVAIGAAWFVTVIGGYAGGWGWTGYPGNTLWEWVQLLLAPIAIATCVVPELIRIVTGHVGDGGASLTTPDAMSATGR